MLHIDLIVNVQKLHAAMCEACLLDGR